MTMKNMDKNIYITKTLIENESLSELDFVLQDDFGFDYENEVDFITIEKNLSGDNYGYADATPVKIDDFIKILQDLKEKGSTHIQIEDHCDHQGYDISAYEIRLSTDAEVSEYDNKYKIEKEKEERIRKLNAEINKIKNETK